MGRKSKAEKAKVKISLVGSKVKVVSKSGNESNLEGDLEKESKEQFGEFIETGQMKAPVLETGQTEQGPRISPIERTAGERPEATQPGQVAGATINPEFSMYEIARGLGRPGAAGAGRVRYETARGGGDEVMQKRIQAQRADEMQSNIANARAGFTNPELERLRAGDDRGGKYYEASVKGEEVKRDRKMPWEV